ncbi:MAG: hypothetical protein AAGF47_10875 [Planctomycetota bacterium]
MNTPPRTAWLFSMTRSGSSAAVYASAHALGWQVADEPFGPWDRTGPPYNYPDDQPRLHRAHRAASEILSEETSRRLDTLLARIASGSPGVIIKMPHDMVDPADLKSHRPSDTAAFMIRNPLERLNSLHTRGWQATIQRPHDLERFKQFAARWLTQPRPHRLTFDEFLIGPRRFFRRLWRTWDIDFTEEQIEAAVAYRGRNYHESSAETMPGRNPHRVLSAHRRAVPAEACGMYLADPVIAALFERLNWSTDPDRYHAANGDRHRS